MRFFIIYYDTSMFINLMLIDNQAMISGYTFEKKRTHLFIRFDPWVQSYKGTKPAMKKGRALAPPKPRYLSQ